MSVGAWTGSVDFWIVVGFHLFIIAVLALDLGFLRRGARAVKPSEAAIWSGIWILLALVFAGCVWKFWQLWNPDEASLGPERALQFIAGYLIEKSLSIDNLFVFLVIFRYFSVPAALQQRVLVWGLIGAVLFRAAMILGGIALLYRFHWLLYVLGAFLIYVGLRLCRAQDKEFDPARNLVLRFVRRWLPVYEGYDSARFWVKRDGRWCVTNLLLVLVVVESTDILFALDSIPAVFGITRDPFIVYTSNIFAILGLRSLYFLLAGFLGMFRYLNVGLGVILAFIGVKMLTDDLYHVPVGWSFAFILVTLAAAILASIFGGRHKRGDTLHVPGASELSQSLDPATSGADKGAADSPAC
jgi:tellurite resistance protein TerC